MSKLYFDSIGSSSVPLAFPPIIVKDFSIVGWEKPIAAMIDTGADYSTVPLNIMEKMAVKPEKCVGVKPDRHGEEEGLPIDTYDFRILLCGERIKVLGAIAGRENYVRLGRDVLIQRKLYITWENSGRSRLMLPDEQFSG